jgi:uncharacterized protein YqjF (DUF2071 family)
MRDHPAPAAPWAIKQTWSDLLFLHWKVEEEKLRNLIPAPLELDTFEDSAYIAVVPFLMTGIRLRWLPPVPGTTRTLEMNVRTYVKYGTRRGVFFFSLDAENGFIVSTARSWYGLPYYKAEMSMRKATYTRYESRRVHPGAPACQFRTVYRSLREPRTSEPGSLEHFLTERYCLFTAGDGKPVRIGEIDHKPWPLRRAEAEIEANNMTEPLGIQVDNRPILHYASSIDVKLWAMAPAVTADTRDA